MLRIGHDAAHWAATAASIGQKAAHWAATPASIGHATQTIGSQQQRLWSMIFSNTISTFANQWSAWDMGRGQWCKQNATNQRAKTMCLVYKKANEIGYGCADQWTAPQSSCCNNNMHSLWNTPKQHQKIWCSSNNLCMYIYWFARTSDPQLCVSCAQFHMHQFDASSNLQ